MRKEKYFYNKDNKVLSKKQIEIKNKFFSIMDRAIAARTVSDIKKLIAECKAFEASLDGESVNMTYIIETLVSKENTIAQIEQNGKRCMLTEQASAQHSMDAAHNEFWYDEFQKKFDQRYKIAENYINSVDDVSNAIDSMELSYNKETGKYGKEQEDAYLKHVKNLLDQSVEMEKEKNYQRHHHNIIKDIAVQMEKDQQRKEQLKKEMELAEKQREEEEQGLKKQQAKLLTIKNAKEKKIVLNRIQQAKEKITKSSIIYQQKSEQHDFIQRNYNHKKQLLEYNVDKYNKKENQLYRLKKSVVECWKKMTNINKNVLSPEGKVEHNQAEFKMKVNFSIASGIDLEHEKNIVLKKPSKLTPEELLHSAKSKVKNFSSTDVQSQVEPIKEEPKMEEAAKEEQTKKKREIKEIIKNAATKIKDTAIAIKTKIFGEKKENWFDVPNCQTPEQKKLVKDMESGKISSDKFNAEMKSQSAQPGTKEYEEFMKEYNAKTKPGAAYQAEQKAIETRRKEQELQEEIQRRRDHPEPGIVDPHPLRAQGKLKAIINLDFDKKKLQKHVVPGSLEKCINIDPPTPTPTVGRGGKGGVGKG